MKVWQSISLEFGGHEVTKNFTEYANSVILAAPHKVHNWGFDNSLVPNLHFSRLIPQTPKVSAFGRGELPKLRVLRVQGHGEPDVVAIFFELAPEVIKKGVRISSTLEQVGGRHYHFIAHVRAIVIFHKFLLFLRISRVRLLDFICIPHGYFALFVEVLGSTKSYSSIIAYELFGVDSIEKYLQVDATIGAISPAVENRHFAILLQRLHRSLVSHVGPIK